MSVTDTGGIKTVVVARDENDVTIYCRCAFILTDVDVTNYYTVNTHYEVAVVGYDDT